jgi:arginine-tRNA-protein transferase
MAHLLEQVIEEPRACSYLSREDAQLEVRVMVHVTAEEFEAMLMRGWRRFGPCYFRPACASCHECVGLRVVVDDFEPTKSQRRAGRAGSRLRRVVGPPRVSEDRLSLYAQWHAEREGARGWQPNAHTARSYALDFAYPHPAAREVAFYDDAAGGKLVALGLWDETPSCSSAAFFFFDPGYASWSLGIANVVLGIADARRRGVPHVYLGYRVLECASLRYKAGFGPHELLRERPEPGESPQWESAETGRCCG